MKPCGPCLLLRTPKIFGAILIFLAALGYSEQATRQYLKRDERPVNREWLMQEQLLVLCARGFLLTEIYIKRAAKNRLLE